MIQGLIYSLISAFGFSSLAVLVKLGYDAGLSGEEMMQYRFTYAVLVLFVVLLFKDKSLLRISWSGLGKCAFIGLVVYWGQTTCFVRALATIPASTTALVLYVYPVTVTLLSMLFLKMKIDRVVVASLVLIMVGCCLVFYDAFLREIHFAGLMYAVGAMTIFSCYIVLVQVLLKGMKPLTATFYVMLFASVSFTLSGDPAAWLHLTPKSIVIGLGLGILPGVVAVTFLYVAIEKIGSAYTSIFSSVEPVLTLIGAALFLNEHVVLLQIGGAITIIAGIAIPNIRMLAVRSRVQPE